MSTDELVAMLEAATEGSRELDEAIAKAIGALPPDAKFWAYNPEDGCAEYEWMDIDPADDDPRPYRSGGQGIDYTTSIDCALTLLPEGFAVRDLMIWPGQPSSLTVYGTKLRGGEYWHHFGDGRWEARAAAPALAICIAALRARSVSQ